MATAVTAPVRNASAHAVSPLTAWHLCSLDAPAVAAVWSAFLARAFGVALPWTAPLALAVAVWLLYAADRLGDAAHGHDLEERHRFHHRHRSTFVLAAAAAMPLLALLVVLLPPALREGWLLLALPLAAYVAAVHWLRLRVPKEPLVGLFFALASAMPLMCASTVPAVELAAAAAALAWVCWINCLAIARWEMMPPGSMDRVSAALSNLFPVVSSCAVMVLVAGCLALPRPVALTCGAAALASAALLLLEHVQHRLRGTTLRALADAALLTPLLLWHLAGR